MPKVLQAEMQMLIKVHGHTKVAQALVQVLEEEYPEFAEMYRRRHGLIEAARKALLPHMAEAVDIERRKN